MRLDRRPPLRAHSDSNGTGTTTRRSLSPSTAATPTMSGDGNKHYPGMKTADQRPWPSFGTRQGRGHPRRARRQRASGAPAGGEDVLLPAGEERSTRRRGSGRSAADGPAARGVDRPTGDPGAARLGAAPGQAGRAALEPEVPGPRACSPPPGMQGADERPVRRRPGSSCWPNCRRAGCRSSPGPGSTPRCG